MRGDTVSKEEKQLAKKLAETVKALPPEKREFLIGFAEGVAAATSKPKEDDDDEKPAS